MGKDGSMRLRRALALTSVLFLLTACGSDSSKPEIGLEDPASPGEVTAEENDGGDATSGDEKGSESSKGGNSKGSKGGNGETAGDGTGGGDDATNGDDDAGGGGGSNPSGGAGGRSGSDDGGSPASSGGSNNGSGGSAFFPASGTYVFAQNGYEEFCAGTCQKEQLPRRQAVKSTLAGRSSGSATVVTEMRSSNSRMTRTTTRFTKGSADITEVYIKFSYSGYQFNQTYRPRPPVESIRFPIVDGDSWSGSWKGDVSGDYAAAVRGRETVNVNGRSINAAKLQTQTQFRGDFEGSANITVWVDPKTKAIVKTAGNLAVDSNFGSYSTAFSTVLTSGPGY
jgi:hypothetical protein